MLEITCFDSERLVSTRNDEPVRAEGTRRKRQLVGMV
jgi:hypothetical protein